MSLMEEDEGKRKKKNLQPSEGGKKTTPSKAWLIRRSNEEDKNGKITYYCRYKKGRGGKDPLWGPFGAKTIGTKSGGGDMNKIGAVQLGWGGDNRSSGRLCVIGGGTTKCVKTRFRGVRGSWEEKKQGYFLERKSASPRRVNEIVVSEGKQMNNWEG